MQNKMTNVRISDTEKGSDLLQSKPHLQLQCLSFIKFYHTALSNLSILPAGFILWWIFGCGFAIIEIRSKKGSATMPYIKNIPHEAIFRLADQVQVQPGQVVSKTLAQNDAVSVTLFAFAAGEEIGTHDSTGDAMVTVLEGVGQFTIDGVPYLVKPGEALVMPAKKPHSVYAPENFKWMLTVIFPHNN
jgi:quercetin dioxygenase-like cupin family protein